MNTGNLLHSSLPSQGIPPDRRRHSPQGGAHAIVQRAIGASAPWQYRLPTDGRKWRHLVIQRHRLTVYLVGYAACYPGLGRISRDLHWSRATTARLLADLKKIGVMRPMGFVSERGTRLRTIWPSALPVTPLVTAVVTPNSSEYETPAGRESETLELPRQNHRNKRKSKDDSARNARALVFSPSPKVSIVQVLNTLTQTFGASEGLALFSWTLRKPRNFSHETYFYQSAANFFQHYEDGPAQAILETFADKKPCFTRDQFADTAGNTGTIFFDNGRGTWRVA